MKKGFDVEREVKLLISEILFLILIVFLIGVNLEYKFYDLSSVHKTLTDFVSSNLLILISLFLLVVFSFVLALNYQNFKAKKVKQIVELSFEKKQGKGFTDLDAFYDLLSKEKSINLSTTAKTFKISRELALEWGRIFEENDLAEIEYPAFADPIIKIKNKSNEEEKE